MAIAITSGTKGAGATTPVTTSAVTTQASGSIFIIGSVFQDTFVSATDSKGNTYTQVGTQVLVDTPNTGNGRVYYDENATGGASHTFSCAYSASGAHTVVAAEITGAALSGALDVSSGVRVTSSPFTTSVTPTAGVRLLVAVFFGASSSNPATHNWSAQGFTLVTGADETDGSTTGAASIAYKLVTADGVTSYSASVTEVGNTAEAGLFLMAFKELLPPAFVVQPTNQSTNSGSTATFTALASGSGGTITYQWQDNRTGSFTNVASGGTSASYTTPNTDATYQGRSYRVVATDSNGSVTSGTAQLNVLGLPVYLWSTSVQAGNDVWLRNPLAAGAAGALSGASALTFSQSAVLEGSGALFGTSPLAFTQAGAISGIAALTATSTLTFTQSGAIAGILAASGTAALTFTQSGVIAGAGVLSGTSPLAFTQSGTLIGNAPITGTSALTFSQSGSISGVGSLSGTSALVFTQSGTLSSLASGSISGTSSLTFSASASIAGSGALVGSSGLTFSQSASLTGTAPVTGSAALAFSPVAVIVGSGALTGTADLVFSVSGTLGQADASALVGSASLLFTASGNLLGSGGEQFTGGFFYAFERERAKREKARRKRLEDEEEASRLKSEVDREIARLLLAQEAKAAQREEMARLTTLVEQAAKIRTRDAFNARVNAALERATQKATISALLTFEREVQRQMDAEDSAVLLMLLND